ncbi:MAG TPA: PEP-CTERM sorting domain-containing protein [Bryobacteraceae bacterium]|jgi:hypothetical protein
MKPRNYLRKAAYFFSTVCVCAVVPAPAATVPFSFNVIYDAFLGSPPGPDNLTVPTTASGSGVFSPFGNGNYSETGAVTFATFTSGDFGPALVNLTFAASFNGGADTFNGTDVHKHDAAGNIISETMTILGGTGIFSGATGFAVPNTVGLASSGNSSPNYFATLETSGTGQITAPGLNAVPEPATSALLSSGLAALAGVAAMCRKRCQSLIP